MILEFLGTKGDVLGNKKHKNNFSLLIRKNGKKIQIDFGRSFLNKEPKAEFLLITHLHPDHIGGITSSIKAKVIAPREIADELEKKKDIKVIKIEKNRVYDINGFKVKAIEIAHSPKYKTFAYLIKSEGKNILVAPDVLNIKKKYLKNIDVYIGDGATLEKPIVRKTEKGPFGHTSIINQIKKVKKYSPNAILIFSHLGQDVIEMGPKRLEKYLSIILDTKILFPEDKEKIKI